MLLLCRASGAEVEAGLFFIFRPSFFTHSTASLLLHNKKTPPQLPLLLPEQDLLDNSGVGLSVLRLASRDAIRPRRAQEHQ